MDLVSISRRLSRQVEALSFGPPVAYVYNPLRYAREPHEEYLRRYGRASGRVLLLGMNPGPFGMAQTGVPFGDARLVREFLEIGGHVDKPRREHPRRPILGFDCARSEVSGSRLWGWAKARYGVADAFFQHFFVANYCPLLFLEASGRNRTPDRVSADERESLFVACDQALLELVGVLEPSWVLGVGNFATKRACQALGKRQTRVGTILHPSPANPRANRGWERTVEEQLRALPVRW